MRPQIASVAADAALTEGVITGVDARSGKLTIRPVKLPILGMPPSPWCSA